VKHVLRLHVILLPVIRPSYSLHAHEAACSRMNICLAAHPSIPCKKHP
jgi:hypothetical protein